MTRRVYTVAVGILLCVLSGLGEAAPDEPGRLRCLSPQAMRLLGDALKISPTVRAMAARIERTDLIVYIRLAALQGELGGATRLVSASAGARFVLVTLDPKAVPADLIPSLGHELRHVIEIADAPDVKDDAGMRALFKRIGWRGRTSDNWETREAIDTGHLVAREMWERPTSTGDMARAR